MSLRNKYEKEIEDLNAKLLHIKASWKIQNDIATSSIIEIEGTMKRNKFLKSQIDSLRSDKGNLRTAVKGLKARVKAEEDLHLHAINEKKLTIGQLQVVRGELVAEIKILKAKLNGRTKCDLCGKLFHWNGLITVGDGIVAADLCLDCTRIESNAVIKKQNETIAALQKAVGTTEILEAAEALIIKTPTVHVNFLKKKIGKLEKQLEEATTKLKLILYTVKGKGGQSK